MIRRASDVAHTVVIDVIRKLARDIARPIIREKTWFVQDIRLITARRFECHIESISHSDVFMVVQSFQLMI